MFLPFLVSYRHIQYAKQRRVLTKAKSAPILDFPSHLSQCNQITHHRCKGKVCFYKLFHDSPVSNARCPYLQLMVENIILSKNVGMVYMGLVFLQMYMYMVNLNMQIC